jgi:hypothetical protein
VHVELSPKMKAFSFFCKGQDSFGGKNIHKLKALIDTFSSIAWIQSLHLLKFENIELYQMKYVHNLFEWKFLRGMCMD